METLSFNIGNIDIWLIKLPCGSDSKESACSTGDLGLILGSGRCPGEGNA